MRDGDPIFQQEGGRCSREGIAAESRMVGGGVGRWQRRWGVAAQQGRTPTQKAFRWSGQCLQPCWFGLISRVSCRGPGSLVGLPPTPREVRRGPPHLLLQAGLRKAAGQRRGPGCRPGAGLAVQRGSPWRLCGGLWTCLSQFWLQATLGHITWLWSTFLVHLPEGKLS